MDSDKSLPSSKIHGLRTADAIHKELGSLKSRSTLVREINDLQINGLIEAKLKSEVYENLSDYDLDGQQAIMEQFGFYENATKVAYRVIASGMNILSSIKSEPLLTHPPAENKIKHNKHNAMDSHKLPSFPLKDRTQDVVFNIIFDNPSISQSKIIDHMDSTSKSTIRHHIKKLITQKRILKDVYIGEGGVERTKHYARKTISIYQEEILEIILRQSNPTLSEIMENTKIQYQRLKDALSKLISLKIVNEEYIDGRYYYSIVGGALEKHLLLHYICCGICNTISESVDKQREFCSECADKM